MSDEKTGRTVERHEVRAICAAGGEVTDGDGDVWCERDGVFGYDCQLYESFVPAKALFEARADNIGPFTVTKEPPAQERTGMHGRLCAKLSEAVKKGRPSPWRRGVPEATGWYWYREEGCNASLCYVNCVSRPTHHPDYFTAHDPKNEYAYVSTCDAAWFESTEFAPLRERAPE